MNLVVNTRILQSHTTGVQRYLLELMAHMPELQRIRRQKFPFGSRAALDTVVCLLWIGSRRKADSRMNKSLVVNTRILQLHTTGVQR